MNYDPHKRARVSTIAEAMGVDPVALARACGVPSPNHTVVAAAARDRARAMLARANREEPTP